MNPARAYLAYRRVQRSQWLDRAALDRLQRTKLTRLLEHAYRTVPFHRRRFDAAGLVPGDIRTVEDLAKLPVVTKAELQALPVEEIVSSAFPTDDLVTETTSGSTGRPFTMHFDRQFVAVRNAMFLRALSAAGYRVGHKLMLVTASDKKPPRRWLRWRYASIADPPERLLDEYERFCPDLLYGCTTPLRRMAAMIRDAGMVVHQPVAVVSTAEGLDTPTRRLLQDVFGAEVFDIYGLTEMGLVAWECREKAGYHLAEDTTIVEFVPQGASGDAALVMTNLELMAMPLIRFQVGDLGVAGSGAACACGRSLRRLARVEGRIVDSVRLADGRTVSPYRLTLAIERVPGLERYQVIQEDFGRFTIRFEGEDAGVDNVVAAARHAIANLCGEELEIRAVREANLDPPPGKKFRVVECRLGRMPHP